MQVTGYSEFWKVNNIYDIAGNYIEWTQESARRYYYDYPTGHYTYNRVEFDCGATNNVYTKSVKKRNFSQPTNSTNSLSSRPVLCIK